MKQWISSSRPLKPLIRPLPWENKLMEFRFGLWSGVSALQGEDGRQLGEGNTRPEIFSRHVPTDFSSCKYKDSRNGKLINVSALRSAMGHFYQACAITVAVRNYHMMKTNRSVTDVPGIWDLHMISRASLALIAYRYRASDHPLHEQLPNDLASQYKFVTGIFMICQKMKDQAHEAISRNEPISAPELYEYADSNDLFNSDGNRVCAGSCSKIIEFLDFANQGLKHPESAKLELKDTEDYLALLRTYVSSLDDWYRYAQLANELDCFIELEVLRRQVEKAPNSKECIQPLLDISRAQHSYWLELLGETDRFDAVGFKQGVIKRQNAMLKLLNKPLIKSIPNRLINSRLNGITDHTEKLVAAG